MQHESEQAVLDRSRTTSPSLRAEHDWDRSLVYQAALVLSEPDPQCKADQTRTLAKLWSNRQLVAGSKDAIQLSDRPSRDDSRVSTQLGSGRCNLNSLQMVILKQ